MRSGRLDGDAASAVLEAAGQRRAAAAGQPAGPAASASARWRSCGWWLPAARTRRSPTQLVISRRTAEHHVQHIYAKVGVSSRAGPSAVRPRARPHRRARKRLRIRAARGGGRARWADLPMSAGRLLAAKLMAHWKTRSTRMDERNDRHDTHFHDLRSRSTTRWQAAARRCVLVHGSWSDRNNWLPVVADLAGSLQGREAYDRRGYGRSQRGASGHAPRPGGRSGRPDREPRTARRCTWSAPRSAPRSPSAWPAAGRSWCAAWSVHEPPLLVARGRRPGAAPPAGGGAGLAMQAVLARVRARRTPRARAEQFVEEIAFQRGAWEHAARTPAARDHGGQRAACSVAEQKDRAVGERRSADAGLASRARCC